MSSVFSGYSTWNICDDGYPSQRPVSSAYGGHYPSSRSSAPYSGTGAASPWRYDPGPHTPPRMRPDTTSSYRDAYHSGSRRWPAEAPYRSADYPNTTSRYQQAPSEVRYSAASSMYGLWDQLKGSAVPSSAPSTGVKCDKCDGAHATEDCPHFRGAREDHKDAWSNYSGANTLPGAVKLRQCAAPRSLPRGTASVVRMPGDGSCLFHSIAYGLSALGIQEDGHYCRRCVADFINQNPDFEITGTPLRSWVDWDSRCNVSSYASRLSGGGLWGGAIEMAACTQIYGVDVAVYEQDYSGGFRRISDFIAEKTPRGAVLILYSGRSHYDALVTREAYSGGAMSEAPIRRGDPYYSQRVPPRSMPQEEDEWCSVM